VTRWCGATAVLFTVSGTLTAQDVPRHGGLPESHVRIESAGDIDPARLFADKVQQLKSRTDLTSLLKLANRGGLFDARQIQSILKDNPQLRELALSQLNGMDLSDPKIESLIAQLARQNNIQLNPRDVRSFLGTIENDLQNGALGPITNHPIRTPPERSSSATTPPAPIDPAAEARRAEWAREIVELANRFPKDRLSAPLRDSPALRKLADDLAGALRNAQPGAEGLDTQLSRWQERWESLRDWLPKDLPNVDLQGIAGDIHLPSLDFDASSPLRSAAPVLGTIADLLPAVAIVVAVLVALAVVRTMRARRSEAQAQAAVIGPWPVAPSRVESRDQLIRAFDYLAQLRLGPRAKSWHHRAVAERLPRNSDEQEPAEKLANLYEWARYSPERAEPSPAALAAAREQLSQLAKDRS
jgi:uncharacterized protein YneF (UPF0154 family)